MAHGVQTPPEVVEQAKAIYVQTASFAETAHRLGMPKSTVFTLINNDDEFEQYRTLAQKEYITKQWANALAVTDQLTQKLSMLTEADLKAANIKDITSALKDIHQTLVNVTNNVTYNDNRTQIQNTVTTLSDEQINERIRTIVTEGAA